MGPKLDLKLFINNLKCSLFTLAGIIMEEIEAIKYIYNTVKTKKMVVYNH